MPFPINNQATGDMTKVIKLVKEFFPFAQKRFGFNKPPSALNLVSDSENAANPLGNTAYYDPAKMSITIYVDGRHPKDILRSFSHELVHHKQNCNGELSPGDDMGEGYAQRNPQMRAHEVAANRDGNMAVRDFTDLTKEGTIYNNDSKERNFMSNTNEKALRQAIRHVVKEALEKTNKSINENEEGGEKITLLDLMKLAVENDRMDLLKVDANTALTALQNMGVEGTADVTAPEPIQGVPAGHKGIDPAWKKKTTPPADIAADIAGDTEIGDRPEEDKEDLEERLGDDTSRDAATMAGYEQLAREKEKERAEKGKEEKGKSEKQEENLKEHKRRRRQLKRQRREEAWGKAPATPETPKAAPAPAPVKEETPAPKKTKKKAEKQPLKEWYDVSLYDRLVENFTK